MSGEGEYLYLNLAINNYGSAPAIDENRCPSHKSGFVTSEGDCYRHSIGGPLPRSTRSIRGFLMRSSSLASTWDKHPNYSYIVYRLIEEGLADAANTTVSVGTRDSTDLYDAPLPPSIDRSNPTVFVCP